MLLSRLRAYRDTRKNIKELVERAEGWNYAERRAYARSRGWFSTQPHFQGIVGAALSHPRGMAAREIVLADVKTVAKESQVWTKMLNALRRRSPDEFRRETFARELRTQLEG